MPRTCLAENRGLIRVNPSESELQYLTDGKFRELGAWVPLQFGILPTMIYLT
jgi:hypothetical protein